MPFRSALLVLLLWLPFLSAFAQAPFAPRDTTKHNRLYLLAGGSAAIYAGSFIGLSEAWYSEQDRTSFHFFNDSREWKQVDKVGHFLTSFHESRFGVDAMRWAGAKEKPAVLIGGCLGFLLQSPIEILDGYAADYGASWYDLGANAAGSALVIGQQLAWQELRITPKFSYHNTRYAALRPNLLGHSTAERALKDYNGQTYWLACNVSKFLPEESRYPKWLGIAIGYGAQQIVYNDEKANAAVGLHAYRQFYLSPDLNFSYLKPKSKVARIALYLLDIVHLPMPALEYSQRNGFRAHGLYF